MKEKIKTERKLNPLKYLIAILVIVFATNPQLIPLLPMEMKNFLSDGVANLIGDTRQIVKVVSFNVADIISVIVMALVLLIVKDVVVFFVSKKKTTTSAGLTIQQLFLDSIQYITALIGLFWGLGLMGVNLSTLFAGAGILALIVGFGAESLIADVFTGIVMVCEKQLGIGDIVEVDGFRGTVKRVLFRITIIEDRNGNDKIFNNSDLRNIINLSSTNSYAICDIVVAHEVDLNQAKAVIETVLKQVKNDNETVFLTVPALLGLQEFTENGVVLRIRADVNEQDRFNAVRILNWALKMALDEAGMGVPHSNELIIKSEE